MKKLTIVLTAAIVLLGSAAVQAGPRGRGPAHAQARWHDPAHYPLYQRPAPLRYDSPHGFRDKHRHSGHRHDGHCGHGPRVVVAAPYYCHTCGAGFRFRHKFYHHINHDHRIAIEYVPRVVVQIGGVWVFGD